MKKHLVFVNNFNLIWVLFLANSYFMMAYFMKLIDEIDDSESYIRKHDNNIKNAGIMIILEDSFVFLVMLQGVLLALTRFREPVYYYMVIIEVRTWFGLTSPIM